MRTRSGQAVRFFNPPGLPYVQAVHGINVAHEFRRHVHDGFCIGLVQSGARVVCHGGTSTVIPENALFVINPGAVHACEPLHKEHSYLIVCVEAARMKALASQISETACAVPYCKNILIHDGELGSRIRRFFSLIENGSSELEWESVLLSVLSKLILNYGDEPPVTRDVGPHERAITRVCEFIEAHYAQDLSLKELSSTACLSPFYFQRLFVRHTGVSPHDYLVQRRIKKARELLLQGHGIAAVAADTGFVDQSHFTRSFKRVTGITPGRYISSMLGDLSPDDTP